MSKKAKTAPPAPTQDPLPAAAKPLEEPTLSHEDAAAKAGIKVKEVFAVNEYADRVHVITVDGQKIVLEK